MKKARKRSVSSRASSRKAKHSSSIRIKRAYDEYSADDGLRILVDRLWPRGLAKSKLKVDAWPKHLAPSNELRRWYHSGEGDFAEFRSRYLAELRQQVESMDEWRELHRRHNVTLITATAEPSKSHAEVLREALARREKD